MFHADVGVIHGLADVGVAGQFVGLHDTGTGADQAADHARKQGVTVDDADHAVDRAMSEICPRPA